MIRDGSNMMHVCVGPTATETDHSFKHMDAFSVRWSQSAAETSNESNNERIG